MLDELTVLSAIKERAVALLEQPRRSQTAVIKSLLPLIDHAVALRFSHRVIREVLKQSGLEISAFNFKTALQRARAQPNRFTILDSFEQPSCRDAAVIYADESPRLPAETIGNESQQPEENVAMNVDQAERTQRSPINAEGRLPRSGAPKYFVKPTTEVEW
jgi:hypothetical protein